MAKLNVLLTGGGGRIGKYVNAPLAAEFNLRHFDRAPVYGDPATVLGDLTDLEALKRAMDGFDVVIHLAATSDVAPFIEQLVPNNVVGLYNTFEACVAQKVRRLIFASSCQAVCRHPRDVTITGTTAPAPVSLYGATKALGEAMGRWYHDKHQLEFIALRIGWFQSYEDAAQRFTADRNPDSGSRALWLSPKDCAQLLICAARAPQVGYLVTGGTSKVQREWLGMQEAREVLGYFPQDAVDELYPPDAPKAPAQPEAPIGTLE